MTIEAASGRSPDADGDGRHIPTALVLGVVAVGAFVVADADDIANGFRLSEWMQAHQQFSYEHDFVRRGLVGEVLRQLSYPNTPRPMYVLSAAIYFAVAALTARLAWDALLGLDRRTRQVTAALLLVLPFALPHLAFEIGRPDVTLYLLVLPLILWRRAPLLACVAIAPPECSSTSCSSWSTCRCWSGSWWATAAGATSSSDASSCW